jgi:hypothetical protein
VTNGIGNPDWQRRYVISATPLYAATFTDANTEISPTQDTNGFQYLMVSSNNGANTAYTHMQLNWYRDAAQTQFMIGTDWTIPPASSIVQRAPVMSRYYTLSTQSVGGATGGNINLVVYGTNADQENLLTQNTALPLGGDRTSIIAGATHTVIIGGIFGGRVSVNMDDDGNNKWTLYMEYYNWNIQGWVQFMTWHGTDKGQSFTGDVMLPYAPIRMNVRNDDTVAHFLTWSVIAP